MIVNRLDVEYRNKRGKVTIYRCWPRIVMKRSAEQDQEFSLCSKLFFEKIRSFISFQIEQ